MRKIEPGKVGLVIGTSGTAAALSEVAMRQERKPGKPASSGRRSDA